MSGENLKSMLVRPVLAGIVGYAGSMAILGSNIFMEVRPLGTFMRTEYVMGLASAIGDGLGQFVHGVLMPHISKDSKLRTVEGAFGVPLLGGAATTAVALVFDDLSVSQNQYWRPFAVGALAAVGAEYLDAQVLQPFMAS